MIIIKNIILYFIQIRHTDDFPSTGTRLVRNKLVIHRSGFIQLCVIIDVFFANAIYIYIYIYIYIWVCLWKRGPHGVAGFRDQLQICCTPPWRNTCYILTVEYVRYIYYNNQSISCCSSCMITDILCQMWRFSIAILWHEPATIKQIA